MVMKALIIDYYVPSLSGLIVDAILASLDIAIVREFMVNRGDNNVDKKMFQFENMGTVFRALNQIISSNAYDSDFEGISVRALKWDNKKFKNKKIKFIRRKYIDCIANGIFSEKK